jgi:AcrR family transcriptional regulator
VTATASAPKRRYDNTLRRERAAQTGERIVAAAAELLRTSSVRNWGALTIRAVAEHAGVNERTVYRHFSNERALRDAVMHRLEQDAGIDLDALALGDIAAVTARTLEQVSRFPREPRPPLDETLDAANRRRQDALLAAVGAATSRWSTSERAVAAALFDVLWSVAAYERLVVDWQLDREQAIGGITWLIGLVEEAINAGRRPK